MGWKANTEFEIVLYEKLEIIERCNGEVKVNQSINRDSVKKISRNICNSL